MNPNRSRSGAGSSPARVVAPTTVNGGSASGIALAPAPLPTTTSTRKSSIATYSNSSAGRARRWISSRNSTSPSSSEDSTAARSPACWIAGPDVSRKGAPSSAAMIIASVVLPSPGGPDSSTWSGGPPRCTAACSTSDSWSRTTRWPTNSSSRLGRSAASAARSTSSAPGRTSRSVVTPASSATARPQRAQRGAQDARDVDVGLGCGVVVHHAGDGLLRGLGVPAEADERLDDLVAPVTGARVPVRSSRRTRRRARRAGRRARARSAARPCGRCPARA